MMVEGKGADRLEHGALEMRLGYGFSVFHCLPQSLAEAGVGLDGLMDEATARELATQAGFSSFTVLAVEDPVKVFYHLTP